MKNEPMVSFDAMLELALREAERRELAALPDDDALRALYPDMSELDRRVKKALEPRRLSARLLLRCALVVVVASALVFGTALTVSADLRGAVANAIFEFTDREMRLTYEIEGEPEAQTLPAGYTDHYVPEGFVLDEEGSVDTETLFSHNYCKIDGKDQTNYTVVCYTISENGQMQITDNEHTEYKTIKLGDILATLGTSKDTNGKTVYYLFWEDEGIHHMINGELSVEELLKVAEGIY